MAMAALTMGCAGIQKKMEQGLDASVAFGKSALHLTDVVNPLIPDPSVNVADLPPGTEVPKVVNPALVAAAQDAATTFGGRYAVPLTGIIGLAAGLVPYFLNRKKTTAAPPPPSK